MLRTKRKLMDILGGDGFPIPNVKKTKDRYTVICPICMGAHATMKVARNGNWIIRCPSCVSQLYLNDTVSINLFRGLQTFLNDNPEHQVAHTTGLIKYAPQDGE
jgi:hypothetical protein